MSKVYYFNRMKKSLLLIFLLLFVFYMQSCDEDPVSSNGVEAPTNLTVTNSNPSSFQISWTDNSDDETGFSVERSKDSGNFSEIDVVAANVTEFTDALVEAGVYSYRVRAERDGEYSGYSNTVTETIEAPNEHDTDITSDETWSAGIHLVDGYVYISDGAVLTIEAGCVVKFAQDAALVVQTNSGLIADGTNAAITFTGQAAQNGYWRFIRFDDDALDASCKLINCVVEYGGGYSAQSAQLIIENDAMVDNCTFRYSSSSGVEIDDDARPTFTNNTATLNGGSPVIAGFTSAGSIGAGTYSGNTNDYIDLESGTISQNTTILKQDVPYLLNSYNYVENANLSVEAGAAFLMNSDAALVISTNGGLTAIGTEMDSIYFSGLAAQKGYWRYISFESDAIAANCKLDYCVIEYGGGYSSTSASMIIENDGTVTNSKIRYSESHGVEIDGNANPTFNNNTITANDKSPLYGSFKSMTSIGYGDYAGNADDFIDLDNNTLSQSGTLKKQNVPYRFNGYNYIEEATLTIEAGTRIYFNQTSALIVTTNGGMIAQGTVNDSIYFSSNVAQNGYWRYIEYSDVAKDADCIMDYCHLAYGGGYSSSSAILFVNNDATVSNSTIRSSQSYGLKIEDQQARPAITDNVITLNTKSPVNADFEHLGSIGYGDYLGNMEDFLEIDSGTLTESLTLKKQNVPYRFNSYSYITNATLTVEAGTVIKMNNAAALIVDENGGLIADGTAETITITGYVASKGHWRYIQFNDNAIAGECQLINCLLEYGGGYSSTSAILDIQNVPTVTGNTFQHSFSYGIIYDISAGAHSDYEANNSFNDNSTGNVNGY